ncbi:hypothetical protein FACS189434_05470 [Bacteroidia bacterium]|nr:hypothetical protein FACS189434_05470 [Bacteroidia bacterium]
MKKIFMFMVANILFASMATLSAADWCGNSFIVVDAVWYTGSNEYIQPSGKFDGANLGLKENSFTLAGELQVYPNSATPAEMFYQIDTSEEMSISLPKTGDDNNNSKHYAETIITIDTLAEGTHTLKVWFKYNDAWDSNNSQNFIATFTVGEETPAPTTWVGNSFIVVDEVWYNCSGTGNAALGDLGVKENSFKLAGELQVFPNSDVPAEMFYQIDTNAPVSISLPKTADENSNSKHSAETTIVIDTLSEGTHTLAVWFKHGELYDSNNTLNFISTFTVGEETPAPTTWVGNSFIVVDETWYKASNAEPVEWSYFDAADLGVKSNSFTLAGELQVFPNSDVPAEMFYQIDANAPLSISLPKTGDDNNNSKHYAETVVSVSALTSGAHTLAVWFKHGELYDSNNTANYIANFTVNNVSTSVADTSDAKEPKSVEYFTVSGQKVSENFNGLVIKKTIYADGEVKIEKVLK